MGSGPKVTASFIAYKQISVFVDKNIVTIVADLRIKINNEIQLHKIRRYNYDYVIVEITNVFQRCKPYIHT